MSPNRQRPSRHRYLTAAQCDVLITHIDAEIDVEVLYVANSGDVGQITRRLLTFGLLRFTPDGRRTVMTEDGRMHLCAILANYVEILSRTQEWLEHRLARAQAPLMIPAFLAPK